MKSLPVPRWRTLLGLLVAANIAAAVMVSEARGFGALQCASDAHSKPEENCFCQGSGSGAQCVRNGASFVPCASNTFEVDGENVFMPIWDPDGGALGEGEWTQESCAEAN